MEAPPPEKLRLRLAAWARYAYVKMGVSCTSDMARQMGHAQSTLNDIIQGAGPKGRAGLDFLARLGSFAQESLDRLVYTDPPEQFFRPGVPAPGTPLASRPKK